MELCDVSAVVSGGASGLGQATAIALAEAGAAVVVLDLPGAHEGAGRPPGTHFAAADVRDEQAVSAALDQAERLGPLRVLVNCAGTGVPAGVLDADGHPLPPAHFRRVLEINLFGTFNVVRLAAARMEALEVVAGERGVIVNTASIAAFNGQRGDATSAASKAGVVGLTLPLARDLAERLACVVAIAPGLFDTPLLGAMPQPDRDRLADAVPHPRRFGRPAEFGALVEHVVRNPMLHGEVVRLDGAVRLGSS